MKRLPKYTADELKELSVKKLLQVRTDADEHFFLEMNKRQSKADQGPYSSKLEAAIRMQDLVQSEFSRRAQSRRVETITAKQLIKGDF